MTAELGERQERLDQLLIAEGAGHIVHDLPVRADGRAVSIASRPWRLDPVPYVIGAEEFAWLERAVTERMVGAESLLGDLYGDRRLVAERVVDPAELWATSRYRLSAMASRPARWLTTYSVDVVRDVHGRWHAIQELTDTPTGLGYMLLSRAVTDRLDGGRLDAALPTVDRGSASSGSAGFTGRPRSLRPAVATLHRALAQTTPLQGPRVAILTGGIGHASYVEHSYLANQLGFNLVEGADLVVRQRRLWLRTLAGLAPIDVLHRRLEDNELDPLEVGTKGTAGVPSVLLPVQAGTLSLANAYGSGLVQAPELSAGWDRAVEALTGQMPVLALVRAPVGSARAPGIDRWIPAPAERVDRFVDGELLTAPVVVRMHAIADDEGVTVVPGGAGRVIDAADDPRHPTPCAAKDVVVLGPPSPVVVAAPTALQVDLIASVPTRAADSLYWLGRAAERAEALARMLRVIVPAVHESAETDEMLFGLLVSLRRGSLDIDRADLPPAVLAEAVDAAGQLLARDVGVVLAEASSVREFLSTTIGRVLGSMVDGRAALQLATPATDTIDEVLLQLSAFAGLWTESVLRGPAWSYGEFGRRYERAVATLSTVAAALEFQPDVGPDTATSARALECVLAANDSLVAYRRRHRSDVAVEDVAALLVADARNPRSVAASLAAMRGAAATMGWDDGRDALQAASVELQWSTDDRGRLAGTLRSVLATIDDLAGSLTATRLVAPPGPMSMGAFM